MLVLGTLIDPHVARVVRRLDALGVRAQIVDYLAQTEITYTLVGGDRRSIVVEGEEWNPKEVIWSRLKLARNGPFYFSDTLTDETPNERERRYSLQEQQWLGLYDVLLSSKDGVVINDINRFNRSVAKPAQQLIASRCGLNSPNLVVSNCKEDLVAFAEAHSAIVTKPISAAQIPGANGMGGGPLMTYAVDVEEIRNADPLAFKGAPIMLQERVAKEYELRVVVTRNDYRAYSINSQDNELTALDWRRGMPLLKFSRVTLPKEITAALQQFLVMTSRDYGSFDLIVDPSGGYWFLECNADGQWGWMEEGESPEISEMLAAAFAAKGCT